LIQAVKNSRQKGYHGDKDEKVDIKSTAAVNQNVMKLEGEQSQTRILDLMSQFADMEIYVKDGEPHHIDKPDIRKNIKSSTLKA
jgi:hypothetical protein